MKHFKKLCLILASMAVSPTLYSQTCNDNVVASTPDSAFTVNNNGTVTHNPTGLMWKVCTEGQGWSNGSCLSVPTGYNWQQALQVPEVLNVSGGYAGKTDWRVPNVKEVMSILEVKCSNPPVNETIFNATPSGFYWTSTPTTSGSPSPTSRTRVAYYGGGLGSLIGVARDPGSNGNRYLRLVRNAP